MAEWTNGAIPSADVDCWFAGHNQFILPADFEHWFAEDASAVELTSAVHDVPENVAGVSRGTKRRRCGHFTGIGVRDTNHSLRATALTRMFTSGISEKVIADRSGHRSTKALRCYERTSEQQQQAMSAVINRCSEAVACQPP